MSLNEKEIRYTIHCEPEDTPLAGNVMASGDQKADQRAEEEVQQQLDDGNEWAWCTVVVTASHADLPFKGRDVLGCCSYTSEQDFRQGGYFEDMCAQALDDFKRRYDAVIRHDQPEPHDGADPEEILRDVMHGLTELAVNGDDNVHFDRQGVSDNLHWLARYVIAGHPVPDPREIL